jgi:MFS superfamily sulfate permease-like transporter
MEVNYVVLIVDVIARLAFDLAIGVAVPIVVAWLFVQLQKAGLNVSTVRRQELEAQVAGILAEVEEVASAKVKAGIPVDSQEKLESAVAAIIERQGVSRPVALFLVHSILPRIGLGAAAALTDLEKRVEAEHPRPGK